MCSDGHKTRLASKLTQCSQAGATIVTVLRRLVALVPGRDIPTQKHWSASEPQVQHRPDGCVRSRRVARLDFLGGGQLRQVDLADDVDQGAGGVTAFRPLQQLQAQMTEDLWTRDSGSTALLESDLDALLHDVELISGQFDFMQQRVQAQDVISSSVQRLRRRSMHKLSELEQWQREMDQLIDAGQLHMLNQSLGHDLSQLSERHHGILPRGAREAAFYKHNYANKLHLGGADPLVEVERMVDAEEAGVNGREDRLRGLSQQPQDPKGLAWQAAGGRSLSSKSRSGTVLQASSASTEAFPSALPGAEQGNSIVWPKEVEAAASGQGKAGAREGDVML